MPSRYLKNDNYPLIYIRYHKSLQSHICIYFKYSCIENHFEIDTYMIIPFLHDLLDYEVLPNKIN